MSQFFSHTMIFNLKKHNNLCSVYYVPGSVLSALQTKSMQQMKKWRYTDMK